jgi:NAD(P)-dependent dehydrogenase (short-subunit alcohol dehydrogenase family)
MEASMERCALVTGAGSGIGRAAALALLEAGWRVALAGRRAEALEETRKLAGSAGKRALPVPTDVTDESQVKALFEAIRTAFGRLDLLFNNAGMGGPPVAFDQLSFEQWRKVAAVNLDGAFLCAREAFAMMRRQDPMGGRIINNGSISAHAPRPNSAPYTATKHAITGLTKSLALDGRPYDIACGQIDIGNASSDMASVMLRGVPQANGAVAPEPVMDLKHVADAVVHMASLPLDANVLFMTVMATKMPFVGRG